MKLTFFSLLVVCLALTCRAEAGTPPHTTGGLYTIFQIGSFRHCLGLVDEQRASIKTIACLDPYWSILGDLAAVNIPGEPLMVFPATYNVTSHFILALNVTNGAIVAKAPSDINVNNLAYNPNTKEVLVYDYQAHRLSAFDLFSGKNRTIVDVPRRDGVFGSGAAFDPCSNIYTVAGFTGIKENKNMFVNINVVTGAVTNGTGPIIIVSADHTNNFTNTFAYASASSDVSSGCKTGAQQPLIGTVVNSPYNQPNQSYFFSTFDPNTGSYEIFCGPKGCPELPLGKFSGTSISGYIPPFMSAPQKSTITGAYGSFFQLFRPLTGNPAQPASIAYFDATDGSVLDLFTLPIPYMIWSAAYVYY